MRNNGRHITTVESKKFPRLNRTARRGTDKPDAREILAEIRQGICSVKISRELPKTRTIFFIQENENHLESFASIVFSSRPTLYLGTCGLGCPLLFSVTPIVRTAGRGRAVRAGATDFQSLAANGSAPYYFVREREFAREIASKNRPLSSRAAKDRSGTRWSFSRAKNNRAKNSHAFSTGLPRHLSLA